MNARAPIGRLRSLVTAAGVALALAVAASPPATAAVPGLFAADSIWNAPLPVDAQVAANSGALVADLQRQVAATAPWINTWQYSVPVYTVPADQPRVRVALDVNVPALQQDFASVPLPANALPAAGTDASLTVHQPATDTFWEFWRLRKGADGWHARWGGRMANVSANPGWFPSPYGATATSLPLIAGLIRAGELQAGNIEHALALAIPQAKAAEFVWPAQRTDGSATHPGAIPAGTLFRLDPSLDLTALGLTPAALTIARAAQRYGIIVRDGAGAVTFFAEDPSALAANPYGALFGGLSADKVLQRFPWDRLQVVSAQWAASAARTAAAAPAVPPPATAPAPARTHTPRKSACRRTARGGKRPTRGARRRTDRPGKSRTRRGGRRTSARATCTKASTRRKRRGAKGKRTPSAKRPGARRGKRAPKR